MGGNFFAGDLHIQKIVVSLHCQTTKGVRQRHKIRAYSSAGLEHLPYKQGVIGSNPIGPTNESCRKSDDSFSFMYHGIIIQQIPIFQWKVYLCNTISKGVEVLIK